MQGTAAALVPSTMAKQGKREAQRVADRTFVWGSIVGVLLGAAQFAALPWLVLPLFSTGVARCSTGCQAPCFARISATCH
jgi:hypothetical protein